MTYNSTGDEDLKFNLSDINLLNDSPHIHFSLFFDLSPDLLCIAGFDGYFKRVNKSVSKTLGYTIEELLSRPIGDFVLEEDKEKTRLSRQHLLDGTPLVNFENRYVTQGGEIVWLHWTSISVNNEDVIYGIAKNVTHKKKMEEERNQAIARLSKMNDDLKLLNYTTSHDLRTPVNNLLAVFSLLDDSKIHDEETLEFIGILKSATENLKDRLNSYVDTLNQQNGALVGFETLNFGSTLSAVLCPLKSLIEGSKTLVKADFSKLEKIKFNKSYLESILLNLITNSIKYVKPGESPDITIQSEIVDGQKRLIFADRGQGFDMEDVKNKIFGFRQRFHTSADSKGIGLYLVYNHVTSLGGTIDLKSSINEGSTFTITFGASA